MRPSKLTRRVISIFNEVLATEHNALVCTDEELCILVNERLTRDERISYRTFQRYKAKAMRMMTEEEEDEEAQEAKTAQPDEMTELYQKLYVLCRKAIIKQKNRLMGLVIEAKQGWQRYKWLLEKKMQEWQPPAETGTDPNNKFIIGNVDWSKYKLGLNFT